MHENVKTEIGNERMDRERGRRERGKEEGGRGRAEEEHPRPVLAATLLVLTLQMSVNLEESQPPSQNCSPARL